MKKPKPDFTFKCECTDTDCGILNTLDIFDFKGGDIEICGVYLTKQTAAMVIRLLVKINNSKIHRKK
jgi:hypothetical protein